jgi:hypothetical protein
MPNEEMGNHANEYMEHDNGNDDSMDQLEEKRRGNRRPITITHYYTQLLESDRMTASCFETRMFFNYYARTCCILVKGRGMETSFSGTKKLIRVLQNNSETNRMLLCPIL